MKIAGIECVTRIKRVERMEISGPRNQCAAIQDDIIAQGWTVILSMGCSDHKDQFVLCVEREIWSGTTPETL